MTCLSWRLAAVHTQYQPSLGFGSMGGDGQMNRAVTGKYVLAHPGMPDGMPTTWAKEARGRSYEEHSYGTRATPWASFTQPDEICLSSVVHVTKVRGCSQAAPHTELQNNPFPGQCSLGASLKYPFLTSTSLRSLFLYHMHIFSTERGRGDI